MVAVIVPAVIAVYSQLCLCLLVMSHHIFIGYEPVYLFFMSHHVFIVQYQSEEVSEEFKISSFVSMTDSCAVIGVPYSSSTGLSSWLSETFLRQSEALLIFLLCNYWHVICVLLFFSTTYQLRAF